MLKRMQTREVNSKQQQENHRLRVRWEEPRYEQMLKRWREDGKGLWKR